MHRQYSMLSMLLVNSATKTCHDCKLQLHQTPPLASGANACHGKSLAKAYPATLRPVMQQLVTVLSRHWPVVQ